MTLFICIFTLNSWTWPTTDAVPNKAVEGNGKSYEHNGEKNKKSSPSVTRYLSFVLTSGTDVSKGHWFYQAQKQNKKPGEQKSVAGKKTPVISLIRTRTGQNERAYLQHCSVKIRIWREKWWDGSSSLKANHVLSRFRLQRRKDQFILSLYLSLSQDLSHMFVIRKTKKNNLTSVKRKKKEREKLEGKWIMGPLQRRGH